VLPEEKKSAEVWGRSERSVMADGADFWIFEKDGGIMSLCRLRGFCVGRGLGAEMEVEAGGGETPLGVWVGEGSWRWRCGAVKRRGT